MLVNIFGGFVVGIGLLVAVVPFVATQHLTQELGGPNFDREKFVRDYRSKHWPDYDVSSTSQQDEQQQQPQNHQWEQGSSQNPQAGGLNGGYGRSQPYLRPPSLPQSQVRPEPRSGGQRPNSKAPRARSLFVRTTTQEPTPPPTPEPTLAPAPAPTRRRTRPHTPPPTPAPTERPAPPPTHKPRPRPKPSPKPRPQPIPPKPTKRPKIHSLPAPQPSINGGGGTDPNAVFLQCCHARNVPSSCLSKCNFDTLNQKVLTAMFLGSDPCPRSAGSDLLSCAASDKDHTSCCANNKVSTTSAGDKCLGFCNLGPRTTFQIDVNLLPCWAVLENIKTCFKQDIIESKG